MATEHSQHKTSISDEDHLSSLDRRGKGGVRACKLLVVALEVVVGCEGDALALGEFNLLGTVSEETRADLRSPILRDYKFS